MHERDDDVREAPDTDAQPDDQSSDESNKKLERRGDVEKCPVCGSRVDRDAYHCPTCRNYFCFHCLPIATV